MNRIVSLVALTVVSSVAALAEDAAPAPVPEIDAGTAATAFALVAGGVAIFRARRRSKD